MESEWRVPWRVATLQGIRSFTHDELASGGGREHLEVLLRDGVFRVVDCPNSNSQVVRLSTLLASSGVVELHFGSLRDIRIFGRSQNSEILPDAGLELGTDLAFRHQPPTAVAIQCLRRSGDGGNLLLADGLAVADELRRSEPSTMTRLESCRVLHEERAGRWHYRETRPVVHALFGQAAFYLGRDKRIAVAADGDMVDLAITRFKETARHDEFCVSVDFRPGEMMFLDNTRVLHGRSSIEGAAKLLLHWQKCYLHLDDFAAEYRRWAEPARTEIR